MDIGVYCVYPVEYLRISQCVMKIMDEARRQSGIEFPADRYLNV